MPEDSADAAFPSAAPPDSAEPSTAPRRYLSIDILRALAILSMIEVHAVDHFSEDIAYPEYLFNWAELFGHMSAPLFALLSGLSYALWLESQKRAARDTEDIVKYSLRRGMFVFVLGFAVNVLIWLPPQAFDWDILALIGVAAMILAAVRNWHPGVLIAISVVILLVSSPLRDLINYDSYWQEGELDYDKNLPNVILSFILAGYFPLLPWLIYPLIGFVVGQTYYRADKQASLPFSLLLIGVVMFAVAVAGAMLESEVPAWVARHFATGWPTGFYPTTTVFILGSLGGTFICLWLLNRLVDLNPRVTGTGPILMFFRRYSYFALTAYVVHLAVQLWPLWILAWWQGKTPTTIYLARFMNVDTALWTALALIIVLYLCFIVLDRHKKYSLEHFMRWSST